MIVGLVFYLFLHFFSLFTSMFTRVWWERIGFFYLIYFEIMLDFFFIKFSRALFLLLVVSVQVGFFPFDVYWVIFSFVLYTVFSLSTSLAKLYLQQIKEIRCMRTSLFREMSLEAYPFLQCRSSCDFPWQSYMPFNS